MEVQMIELDQKVSLLDEVSLFQGLDNADLRMIAGRVFEASFEEGQTVFREGEVGDRLYILLDGTMHV